MIAIKNNLAIMRMKIVYTFKKKNLFNCAEFSVRMQFSLCNTYELIIVLVWA